MFNSNFYPTPQALASKMVWKLKGNPRKILEPSAGKGDIVKALESRFSGYNGKADIYCVEIEPALQDLLRGAKHKVIDTDFLTYEGQDKFDAVVMNPPFDAGDKHLLKAIEIMYRGEIVCLLNAETLRNPHTNTRKLLAQTLKAHGAEIEYLKDAFLSSERKTGVEVAMIYLKIDRTVDDDLFAGVNDHAARCTETVTEKHELSTGRTVEELVLEYQEVIRLGTETIVNFYRNSRKVGGYISLHVGVDDKPTGDLTSMMQDGVNRLLKHARTTYWRRTLDLTEVKSRLTAKKRDEFEHALTDRCFMDFTESNVRQFVLNLIGSYEKTLTDAVVDIFDMFTTRHAYGNRGVLEKNIHYFNGWKTNDRFKVGKRVVIPVHAGYCEGAFFGWSGWKLDYKAAQTLRDIDLVASYFSAKRNFLTMEEAIGKAFPEQTSGIESSHFKITCYKKGTAHLTFQDDDVLRRFNLIACKGKNWLPQDYGQKPYMELSHEEKRAVDGFEGKESYQKNLGRPAFPASTLLQIGG